jgi:hypothetical protein
MLLTCLALPAAWSCSVVDPSEDAADGCNAYAAGACQAYARCGEALIAPFGSMAGCQALLGQSCASALTMPDVIGSGVGAAVCGEVMANLDCDALLNNELPPACSAPSGLRANGAACKVSGQCASARCQRASVDSAWGECSEPATAGEPCSTLADCAPGLLCSALSLCVAPGQPGAACGPAAPCRAPLSCFGGSCLTTAQAEQSACQAFAGAFCARLGACSSQLLAAVYGSEAVCTERLALSCQLGAGARDVPRSALGIAGCSQALAAASCNALLENALPAACGNLPGARADGTPCGADAQCQSTRCALSPDAPCGVCRALAGAGEPCRVASDCRASLICSSDGSCRAPAALGQICDATHPCSFPLSCAAGKCEMPLPAAASCSWDGDRCDRSLGLWCGASRTCEPWRLARATESCGLNGEVLSVCTAGALCSDAARGGVCQGPLADGAACGPDTAPCLAPARCSAGRCAIHDPAVCP